ncbi:unnamed protein product [Ilex paraguariensis]|uniref:PORR domain-containing protein n=1 Tax=Ilex paraguariensis TaxID=185542 RepID=A0ABC8UXK0_9AQUA
MVAWWLLKGWAGGGNSHFITGGFNYQQTKGLVNVKLKWVKDRVLDSVVAGGRELRAVSLLVSIIASNPQCCVPLYHFSRCRGQLGLPQNTKISTFTRKYPSIFEEVHLPNNGGTRVPWFRLTPQALSLHQEEVRVVEECQMGLVDRLRKLLMLTKDRTLPLQTIDQLKWDLGLPFDYMNSLILQYPELFSVVSLPDNRFGLKLLVWDDGFAVSQLEKNALVQGREGDGRNGTLAFSIGFTRGFGLKRKCMEWLEEWQKLPYTSPYTDSSHLDPRTDVSEKRIVGVFHELLHLTIQKKTERKNVSNLRKPLDLPQKFTKVFERHPGIFYISKKCDTQTVVLREAYDRHRLIEKHPLTDIRERYASLMEKGFVDRSRGLYKKNKCEGLEEDPLERISGGELSGFQYEGESDDYRYSEYESDKTMDNSC